MFNASAAASAVAEMKKLIDDGMTDVDYNGMSLTATGFDGDAGIQDLFLSE